MEVWKRELESDFLDEKAKIQNWVEEIQKYAKYMVSELEKNYQNKLHLLSTSKFQDPEIIEISDVLEVKKRLQLNLPFLRTEKVNQLVVHKEEKSSGKADEC